MSSKFSKAKLLWLLLPLLTSCQTAAVYPPHALAEQILSSRPGHDGKLTNKTSTGITDYDLADPAFQTLANQLNISCHIGGHRYKICKDEHDAAGKPMTGFCRISYTQDCFLFICGKKKRKLEFFPISPYSAVLASGVKCFNEEIYPEEKSHE